MWEIKPIIMAVCRILCNALAKSTLQKPTKYLSLLDLIPSLYKMLDDIEHTGPNERHMRIVPRHSRSLEDGHSISDKVPHILEIKNAGVVVVLTRK